MYLRALDEMHSDEARDFLLRLDLTDAEFADLTAQLDYACRKFELVIWNAGEKPNAGEEKEESNE